ncbi:MAG: hypothetical protein JO316_10465 [Abitibacteriaceae bacterium]|nr:hypothetical protein [Abditibacteriaceae bacterium]MBV9865765.1 hypothetical protein [Abditibacteriaceae bacterium]
MIEQTLKLLREQDAAAAIDFLTQQKDATAVAKTYRDLVEHCYWKDKDLTAVILMARAGIQHGLVAARQTRKTDIADDLRSSAKIISFNLASYTWPGWDEPGIAIGPGEVAIGLDAAKTNLRLAHELKKGDLPLSRAYWMLAGQQLARQEYGEAQANFEAATRHATAASARAEELLAQGFSILTQILAASETTALQSRLDEIKAQLNSVEHGPDFVQQIETAHRVFTLPVASPA